jgi:eukaryotic-like serine/threonine-protein kinase
VSFAVYQFGEFRLHCGRFELSRRGRRLKLERKPLELLVLLVTRHGQVVTRDEIAKCLWEQEVFVDIEHGINTAIRKIRQTLGDGPGLPQFVQTISGSGYRFIATVTAVEPEITEPAQSPDVPIEPPAPPEISASPPAQRKPVVRQIAAGACVLFAIGGTAFYRSLHRPPEIAYTQLTDFTDSAVAPALSPDGRTVAFIRGSSPFLTPDQIYAKMLPDGEARRLTDDSRPKYGLAFSPDGSRIAYSVMGSSGFATYTVSALGGDSHLLMENAAGLVWLDQNQLLFSQARSGIHLGVVTATATRDDLHEIYLPEHERGMAHYSYPSPDRHWAVVVEMNGNGGWAPCRLISLDGRHAVGSAGPDGACISAGWSPDGSWMYFTAYVDGQSHLWRQRFPGGSPEQLTFGPAEEEGVAVEPSGRSLITSVGVYESAIWIHDPAGERPLSSEGKVVTNDSPPAFSPDNNAIYYLLQRGQQNSRAELWRTSVDSGKSEAVFPGIAMTAYDVSPDGKQVVYATAVSGGTRQVWLAPLDRSSSPVKVGTTSGAWLHFGAPGQILFEQTEGNSNYLEQMNLDGSNRSRVLPYPVIEIQSVSPARRWVIASVPHAPDTNGPAQMAIPIPMNGGTPRRLCASFCSAAWSTSGKFLFVQLEWPSSTTPGRILAIPVEPGESLPVLPPGGIPPQADPSVVEGSQLIPHSDLVPGNDLSHFAYVNTTVHRNLYRISLP